MEAKTNYGILRGTNENGCAVFKGVPYAKPPVGALRFAPPEKPEPWDGVRDAVAFGAKCVQAHSKPGDFYYKEFFDGDTTPSSEDSLFLNIWTPGKPGDALPVLFWVHGGAFLGGFSSEMEFDGAAFCEKGVILVSTNYRLGALGFLAHPWLTGESERGVSGNYGIFDQIAALTWVRENIAAFGGDPERITIFGQSAGAMSVQTLVSSPLAKGLACGAILQSGGGFRGGFNKDVSLAEAEEIGKRFVALSGAKNLEELRALPPEKILELQDIVMAEQKDLCFLPNIDGYVLEVGYDAAMEQGRTHDIPYMIGCTKDDLGRGDSLEGMGALYEGCVNWSLQCEALGRRPAYVYYFTREPQGDDAGAFHSSELWYVFGTLGRSWRPKSDADYELSKRMVEYWANFAKNGEPGGGWRPSVLKDAYVHELN